MANEEFWVLVAMRNAQLAPEGSVHLFVTKIDDHMGSRASEDIEKALRYNSLEEALVALHKRAYTIGVSDHRSGQSMGAFAFWPAAPMKVTRKINQVLGYPK